MRVCAALMFQKEQFGVPLRTAQTTTWGVPPGPTFRVPTTFRRSTSAGNNTGHPTG